MRIPKKIISYLIILIAAGGVCLFGAHIYFKPDSSASIAAFRLGYSVFPFKRSYLSFYSPLERDVNAGYIPQEIDAFLIQRLETTEDNNEFDAIVNFYCLQAGGREGDMIFRALDSTREKIAGSIIRQLDQDSTLLKQIVLLEEIRTGKSLGKGRALPRSTETKRFRSTEEWLSWSKQITPEVRANTLTWWNSDTTWEEKIATDPLEGTSIRVYACCG